MALALIVFVAMTVLRISGGELLAIRTGSMTPMMKPGDLLISRDVDPRTIRRGDVITFRVPEADNTLVTHRVTKVDEKGNSFTTKGDANDTVDPFTTNAKDVLGIRWFSIPDVGRLMVFLSSGIGTALLIGIPAAIYFGQTLADRRALQRARAAAAEAPVDATTVAAQEMETAAAAPDPEPPVPPTEAHGPNRAQAPGPRHRSPRRRPGRRRSRRRPAATWGMPQWGTQVHHVMPAPPPQVIVVQVPQPRSASSPAAAAVPDAPPPFQPTPPPFHAAAPPFHPTPPPFHHATGPRRHRRPATGAAPIAVPAHRLPVGLTQGPRCGVGPALSHRALRGRPSPPPTQPHQPIHPQPATRSN